MKDQNNPNKLHSWSFVAVQAVILVLLVFFNPNIGPNVTRFMLLGTILEWIGWLGILLSAYTIRSSLTAQPIPKKSGSLSTYGLYKYVRHPMYTSVMVLCLGIALVSGSVIKYALVGLLALLFYFKTNYEEKFLRRKYPEYESYTKKTPKFIPFIK
jgi:protein-S-isoprenylcysteine O-methyltransferase Ste14